MTNREVLAVEIDTKEFEAFQKKFAEYKAALADMPAQWDAANNAMAKGTSAFDRLVDLAEQQNDIAGKSKTIAEKSIGASKSISAAWGVTYRYTRLWASEIKTATLQLGKWAGLTSVFSGLLSAGGLYGIDRMATGVSMRRTSALGLGTTIGAQSSFLTNFGRIGNAEGILQSTSGALSDPRSRVFRSLGVSGKVAGMDAPHAFAAILPDIERLLKRTPDSQLSAVMEGYGLGELGLGVEQGRFIKRASHAELEEMRGAFLGNESLMGVESARKWTDFETALDKAAAIIGRAFKTNVVKLAEPLGHVADAFSELIPALLHKGGIFNTLIDDLGKGIDGFSKWLGNEHSLEAVGRQVDQTARQFEAVNQMLSEHSTLLRTVFGALVGAFVGGLPGGVIGGVAGLLSGFDRNRDLTPAERSMADAVGKWTSEHLPRGLNRGGDVHLPSDSYQNAAERMRHLGDKGASLPSGQVLPGLRDLESATADIPGGRVRISSENDDFHHRVNPGSMHTHGLAFDQTLADARRSEEAVMYETKKLHEAGLSDDDFKIIDEYKHPSAHATGGHIHTQFNSVQAANRYHEWFSRNHPNNAAKRAPQQVEVIDATGGSSFIQVAH